MAYGELFAIPGGKAASITVSGSTVTVTGLANMSVGMVGTNLVISGAATPDNNGTFPIASYISASSVTITNPNYLLLPASDANNGQIVWSAPIVFTAALPGTYYKIAWNGIGVSSETTLSNTAYTITVGATDTFEIQVNFQFESSHTQGGPYDIAVFVNGVLQQDSLTRYQDIPVLINMLAALNSGDVVDVRITDTFAADTNTVFTLPHGGSFVVTSQAAP